ncbi:MAG: 50S ribosomal protein L10 [Clostridiaceae bacterium]|nr:50S ribosomal protein L10 [Clostridiaceae bacterium]
MANEKVLEKKKEIVKNLTEKFFNAKAVILADYRGITVEQDTEMRRALRKAGVEYKVYKNTLTRLAVKQAGLEKLVSYLEGPTSIAFSENDVVAPAKILSEYAEKFGTLQLKAGVVEGEVIDISGIKALANLPPREVLIAKVLGGMNAPIAGFVNVLSANIRGLVVALNAIAKQKESA